MKLAKIFADQATFGLRSLPMIYWHCQGSLIWPIWWEKALTSIMMPIFGPRVTWSGTTLKTNYSSSLPAPSPPAPETDPVFFIAVSLAAPDFEVASTLYSSYDLACFSESTLFSWAFGHGSQGRTIWEHVCRCTQFRSQYSRGDRALASYQLSPCSRE